MEDTAVNEEENVVASKPTTAPKNRQEVQMEDILKANPLEQEAETLIMRAIDHQEFRRENTEKSISMLGVIPTENISVFDKSERESTHRATYRSVASTDEPNKRLAFKKLNDKLAMATESLMDLHSEAAELDDNVLQKPAASAKGASAGESLGSNMDILFRGRESKKDTMANTNTSATTAPNMKRDFSIPDAIAEDEEFQPSGQEDGPTTPSSKRPQGKLYSLNGAIYKAGMVRDFQIFVNQRQSSIWTYLKLLLLLLLPAIATACALYYTNRFGTFTD